MNMHQSPTSSISFPWWYHHDSFRRGGRVGNCVLITLACRRGVLLGMHLTAGGGCGRKACGCVFSSVPFEYNIMHDVAHSKETVLFSMLK